MPLEKHKISALHYIPYESGTIEPSTLIVTEKCPVHHVVMNDVGFTRDYGGKLVYRCDQCLKGEVWVDVDGGEKE